MKRLGANTPPSPPEASVIEVTIGFKSIIPIKVNANEKDNGISFEPANKVLMA